ncbi:MAG TPA: adenylate/guanylate cyclase domain-containing protein [Roseiarcus sp.]|nr:adenylate/guanylate cyclase domain-containing protein [Roseiarcus sp.]
MSNQATICKGCWQQMHVPVPLRGLVSLPFRAFGIRPSRMNPNTCTICEMMFTKVMKARQVEIEATILFADLRGYTSLSESRPQGEISEILDAFYDACAETIWEGDGIVNKTMGDAIMAVFNFPIRRADHAIEAVRAARAIQERWRARRQLLSKSLGAEGEAIGVGIGVDSGKINFGEFGRAHHDLTAIGTVVNVASRAQSAAAAGEILVTASVYERARSELENSQPHDYRLKGLAEPVQLWAA